MRHRKDHRSLNRSTDQRMALLRGQARDLFTEDRIKTTISKAKETQRFAEKLITKAKQGDLSARRQVLQKLPDRDTVNHLFSEVAPRYEDRNGGYTRVIRAGKRRGDGTQMAIVELVE